MDRIEGNWFSDLELVGLRTKTATSKGALKEVAEAAGRTRDEADEPALISAG